MTDLHSRNHYFKFRANTADDHQARQNDIKGNKDFYRRFVNNNSSQWNRSKLSDFGSSLSKYNIGISQQSEINFRDDCLDSTLPIIERPPVSTNNKYINNKSNFIIECFY